MNTKEALRLKRHRRVRRRVAGTSQRPRLAVHRSHLHLYVQLIDDRSGKILLSTTTLQPPKSAKSSKGGNVEAAKRLGQQLAQAAAAAGIRKAVFDRGGWPYQGRIKALAEAARSGGLEV